MELKKEEGLLLEAAVQGKHVQGFDTLMLIFKDIGGNQRHALLGCKANHTDQVIKSFQRVTALCPPGWDVPALKVTPETPEGEQNDEGKE